MAEGARTARVHRWEEERALLLPLPSEPFPCAEQVEARAGKTPYVRFDRNDYSAPHSYVRRELLVVADLDTVRVVDGTAVIAEHARCYSAGETIEAAAHVEALVAEKAAARAHPRSAATTGPRRARAAAPSSPSAASRWPAPSASSMSS